MPKNLLKVESCKLQNCSPTARSVDLSQKLFRVQSLDPVEQANELKQKAHKSFMQVIQMEALHQEQIDMLINQHQQEIQAIKEKQQLLLKRVKFLQNQLKNNQRHCFQPCNLSFNLDNIEAIQYKDQSQCIDDSSIMNLRQMLTKRDFGEKLRHLQNELKRQLKFQTKNALQAKNLLEKLFVIFNQINSQNASMREQNEEMMKKFNKIESQFKTLRIQNQSTQKEAKFFSDHIKRIHNDKIILEKKIQDLETTNKILDAKTQKNINELALDPLALVNNLQIRTRKNSTTTLQPDLNLSRQTQTSLKGGALSTKLQRMSSETGFIYHPSQSSSPNGVVSIKNFRKKQNCRMDNV